MNGFPHHGHQLRLREWKLVLKNQANNSDISKKINVGGLSINSVQLQVTGSSCYYRDPNLRLLDLNAWAVLDLHVLREVAPLHPALYMALHYAVNIGCAESLLILQLDLFFGLSTFHSTLITYINA